jgi:ankyrin repeat protein
MKEVADDKPPSLRKWLQDPETHVEDTEVNSFLFHKLLSAHDMIAYPLLTQPKKKQTALIYSARHGSSACLSLLIEAGANVNAKMVAFLYSPPPRFQ